MEKLKNLIHPGKEKDDEVLYGSGQSSGPLHSHPGSSTTRPTGEGSHLGVATGDHHTTHGAPGIGSTSGTGPHSSNLANVMDPRIDAGSRTLGTHSTTGVSASDPLHSGTRPVGEGSHLAAASISRDHHTGLGTSGLGTHDAAGAPASGYGGAIDPIPGSRGHVDPMAGNINKPLPHTPASFIGTGPTLANLPDRTVGITATTGNTGTSGSGHVGVLGGLAAAAAGATSHHQPQTDPYRTDLSHGSTGIDTASTQGSFPLTGGIATGSTTSEIGQSSTQGPIPLASAPPHHHDPPEAEIIGTSQGGLIHHYHTVHDINPTNPDPTKVDPRIASAIQFGHTPVEAIKAAAAMPIAATGVSVGTGYDHTTAGVHHPGRDAGYEHSHSSTMGPHKSNLLNKLDPRVDSDSDGSRTFGSVPVSGASHGQTTGPTRDGHNTIGRESDYSRIQSGTGAGVAAGAGALGAGLHSHGPGHETGYGGAAGPHASNLVNPLDSHGGSFTHQQPGDVVGTSSLSSSSTRPTGTYGGTMGHGSVPTYSGHHHGRDVAAVDGAAAAGAAAYEIGKHHPEPRGTATGPLGSTMTQPYDSTTTHVPETSHTGHHFGRDATIATGAASVGASELPRHEVERISEYRKTEKEHHHITDDKHHHKEEKHGHHAFGFLHRDKDKHHEVEEEKPTHHGAGTGMAAGAAAGLGTAVAYQHEQGDRPHKLHKDPPPQLVAQAQAQSTGVRDPNAPEGRDRFVYEPHTGLPMNVGKYGSTGQGGTDGGPIVGYHEDPAHHKTGRID